MLFTVRGVFNSASWAVSPHGSHLLVLSQFPYVAAISRLYVNKKIFCNVGLTLFNSRLTIISTSTTRHGFPCVSINLGIFKQIWDISKLMPNPGVKWSSGLVLIRCDTCSCVFGPECHDLVAVFYVSLNAFLLIVVSFNCCKLFHRDI